MKIIPSDGQAVLIQCIGLIGGNDDNDEDVEIDPMLGPSGLGAGK